MTNNLSDWLRLVIESGILVFMGGAPLDFPPHKAPGVMTTWSDTDSIHVIRNDMLLARILGPWNDRADAMVLDVCIPIERGLDFSDTLVGFYPLGSEDLWIGFQDPQIQYLASGEYAYSFRVFRNGRVYPMRAGILEIETKRGRVLHFTPPDQLHKQVRKK